MARAAFMALAEMSISGTKISSHLKRSPTTAMPGTRRFSMIAAGVLALGQALPRQGVRLDLVAIDDGLRQWVHVSHVLDLPFRRWFAGASSGSGPLMQCRPARS